MFKRTLSRLCSWIITKDEKGDIVERIQIGDKVSVFFNTRLFRFKRHKWSNHKCSTRLTEFAMIHLDYLAHLKKIGGVK